jgi:hypothetical protein
LSISKCIAKVMRLEKPKHLIIWNGGSSSLLKSTKTIEQGTAHVRNTNSSSVQCKAI